MQPRRGLLGVIALVVAGSGCDTLWVSVTDDCEQMLTCAHYDWRNQDGGTPAVCEPRNSIDAVDDSCGVFVAANGDDAGSGAKETPVKTLAAAIALAEMNKTGRVYACAEEFEEALEVAGGVTIYGGLDCANGWAWIGETKKTTLTAAEGTIPLTMRGGDGNARVRIEDVHVQARGIDASNVAMRGASSIAAIADSVSVELARCVLEAGDAADGADGAAYATSAPAGSDGNAGNEACSEDIVNGARPSKNDCGTPDDPTDDSFGGSGGTGFPDSGGAGTRGTPASAMNGGQGEDATACTAGTAGDPGAVGMAGAGAAGLGEIRATGYVGATASDGLRGATAQGGGGGGGSKGGTGMNQCTDPTLSGGASGASGGSGGCGGAGGKAGGAGGASIALLSVNATLTFESVTLRTGRGGAGGKGGPGQDGGTGGSGGTGGAVPRGASALRPGCNGGNGGAGGKGGTGGGGLGGHSIGIAYKGAAPPSQGATITTGEAGLGGAGADEEHNGAEGIKADVQQF